MRFSGTFNSQLLRGMDTESNMNRKGFFKRAGLALAGVFAVSSAARMTSEGQAPTASQGRSSEAGSALARVRTAEGAVARKV